MMQYLDQCRLAHVDTQRHNYTTYLTLTWSKSLKRGDVSGYRWYVVREELRPTSTTHGYSLADN